MSRDYNSVRDIVTCDYKAMYAYKCEQCIHLSQEIVDLLLYTECRRVACVLRVEKSDLLLLMDDDCLSLISLARPCGVLDIDPLKGESVIQITFSSK